MLRFILRRLLQMLPLLVAITFISFLVMRLAPGDYLTQMRDDPRISAEASGRSRPTTSRCAASSVSQP